MGPACCLDYLCYKENKQSKRGKLKLLSRFTLFSMATLIIRVLILDCQKFQICQFLGCFRMTIQLTGMNTWLKSEGAQSVQVTLWLYILVSSSDFGDKVPHREISGGAKNWWSIFSRVDPPVLESCNAGWGREHLWTGWWRGIARNKSDAEQISADEKKQMQSGSQQMRRRWSKLLSAHLSHCWSDAVRESSHLKVLVGKQTFGHHHS